MTMGTCRECNAKVSLDAKACPACGCPNPAFDAWNDRKKLLLIGAGIVGLAFALSHRAPATAVAASTPAPPAAVTAAPLATPAKAADPPLTEADKKADATVAKLKYVDFCLKLGPAMRSAKTADSLRAAYLRAAEKKYAMPSPWLGGINTRTPVLGMNLCAVAATYGRPDALNTTTTRHGESHQVIYRDRGLYLYLDNDKLTAWQNH